jgi:hypothetical protein
MAKEKGLNIAPTGLGLDDLDVGLAIDELERLFDEDPENEENVELAKLILETLKRRSPSSVSAVSLDEERRLEEIEKIKKTIGENTRINPLHSSETVRGLAPTDKTKVGPKPSSTSNWPDGESNEGVEIAIADIESTIVHKDSTIARVSEKGFERGNTGVYHRDDFHDEDSDIDTGKLTIERENGLSSDVGASTIAQVLSLGEKVARTGVYPVVEEDETERLIKKVESREQVKGTNVSDLLRIASSNGDSTTILIAGEALKDLAHSETPAVYLAEGDDPFKTEDTQIAELFSIVCNNISTLKFLGLKDSENILRRFIFECQNRTKGLEEMILVFSNLKKNLEKEHLAIKEYFIDLLKEVVNMPVKYAFIAGTVKKCCELGEWKDEIAEELEKFLDEMSSQENVLVIPSMDLKLALEETRNINDFEKKYLAILVHAIKYFSTIELVRIFGDEILFLKKNGEEEREKCLLSLIERKRKRLHSEINSYMINKVVDEGLKSLKSPPTNSPKEQTEVEDGWQERPLGSVFFDLDTPPEEKVREDKSKGVLRAFLNKYKGRLVSGGAVLALLSVLGYTGFEMFKMRPKGSDSEPISEIDFETKKLLDGAVLGGVAGKELSEEGKTYDAEKIVEWLVSSASNGVVGAELGRGQADAVVSASNIVALSQQVAEEDANSESVLESVERQKWSYEVKDGDTFFAVVNNWRVFNDFSSLQSKYPFLNRLDNWDLATAMRMVSNKKNTQRRHLDVYKGSDQNAQDFFDATLYEMFMEIYKFRSRSQRNFVIKHMEEGGDFEEILHAINEGAIDIEVKKTYTKRKDQMRGRYYKSRGTANDASLSMEKMDSLFSFKDEGARSAIMGLLASGTQIGDVYEAIKKGYVLDFDKGLVIDLGVSVKAGVADANAGKSRGDDDAWGGASGVEFEELAMLDNEKIGLERIGDDLAMLDNDEIGLERIGDDLAMLDNDEIGLERIGEGLAMLDNDEIGLERIGDELENFNNNAESSITDKNMNLEERMEIVNKGWDNLEADALRMYEIDKAWDEIFEEIEVKPKSIEEIQGEISSETLNILA